MQNLAQFKKPVTVGKVFMVRHGTRPEEWSKRVVACVQTNAVACASRLELMGNPQAEAAWIETCKANPNANASWHWYGKAAQYTASPDSPGAIRYNPRPDLPNAWLEFRLATEEEAARTTYLQPEA